MAPDPAPHARHVATTVHGRYLVLPPAREAPRRWLLGFHGYAQNAEMFLDLMRPIPHADGWVTVSVQALHPFYNNRTNEVVANWMTRQDREHAIHDNIAYVDAVLADLERELGPPDTVVYAGFSQGVAMAYRAALRCRRRGDAVFAVAADIPPELKTEAAGPWPRVRIAVGTGESFYGPEPLRRDREFLESRGIDLRVTLFHGGHEWTQAVIDAAGELLLEMEQRPGPNDRG